MIPLAYDFDGSWIGLILLLTIWAAAEILHLYFKNK